ncbi:MAG: formylglycine-generating enzyme family protein, partial [Treponema sp.]|nr:formylglycine-generating enzyme family protein [Treponema sp.]
MGKKTFNAAGWFLLQLLLAALLSGCTFEHKIEAARKEWKEKKKAEASTPPQAEAVPNEMVYIPGGSFQMGDTRGGGYGVELPAHTVTLGGFYMGKYQVTQAQYLEVMGSNPSYFSNSPAAGEAQWNRPVETVSWYDAIVFCNKLSVAEGL